jgi:hypothetical protein
MTATPFELNDDNEVENNKIVYKRQWLNEDEGTSYIVLDAQVYSKGASVDVSIEIKDCNRQITLDFWFGDENERKTKLAKMDRLIEFLQESRNIIATQPLKERDKKTLSQEIISSSGIE